MSERQECLNIFLILFNSMSGLKDYFDNVDKCLYLEKSSDKLKIIELLIIIATFVATFKIEGELNIFFILFFILLLLCYIMIRKGVNKDTKKIVNVFAFFAALIFSAIISTLLAINAVSDLNDLFLKIWSYIVIYLLYTLVLTLIIWTALKTK